jgi:hypothetical protein
MRFRNTLLACAVAGATLSGCAMAASPVSGFVYNGTKHGEVATANAVGSKSGESCANSILGIVAGGDASVDAAAKAGGVTQVSHVDHRTFGVLGIYAEYCTVVYGN